LNTVETVILEFAEARLNYTEEYEVKEEIKENPKDKKDGESK